LRFREEMELDRKRMNKAWGDLANKMGTIVQDIAAPNIPRLACEEFGMEEQLDLLINSKRRSRVGQPLIREFDIICADSRKVIIVEVESSPQLEHISRFADKAASFPDFYPEYAEFKKIAMLASWSIPESLSQAISAAGLYGISMGDDTMQVVVRPAL